ncbi:MAG TPA: hypothetical protein VMJ32_11715 [Pirellulales bacterium]|nr:hypothetical protein [Pirellulales bacterium]
MKGKNKPVRSFERLETRELLAGNVTWAVVGGSLTVNGDNAANMLQLTEVSGDRWKITGLAGTKIDGKSSVTTGPVTHDVQLYMNGGNDNVTVKNATVPHILNVFGADGNNTTTLDNVKVGYGLGVYGNAGNDVVMATNVNVEAIDHIYYSVFDLGDGNNTVIANHLSAWDMRVYTGSGMDSVNVMNSTLQPGTSSLTVNTGDGRDAVSLSKVKTDAINVDVGGGNMDSVSVVKSTAGTATFADTDGTNGIISGMGNDFGSQTIDPNFKYRSGDLQHDTV